jgi:hypothetical protein
MRIRIYNTVNFLVVLYVYRTWSLTLREELKLRVFEKRMLRKILRSKRDLRKLHNKELHNLYPSPIIIKMIKSRRIGRAGQGM